MICKIIKTIEDNNLLDNAKSVAVGVSGGADSLCLVHALSELEEKYNFIVFAIHVNHNIRGEEAKRDEEKSRLFCENLGVPYLAFDVDVPKLAQQRGISLEECGRQVRYECFAQLGCEKIAVAHTLSDSIETMTFNLIRGTALKGLCGIPVCREPNIIRPLIECTREEIEAYCEQHQIEYVTDSTNLSDDYTRNFIRHQIIPSFERVNSSYVNSFNRCMKSVKTDNDFLHDFATKALDEAKTDNGFKLSVFQSQHESIVKRMIAIIIEQKLNKPVESRHIDLVFEIIKNAKGKVQLSKDLYIFAKGDIINFSAYLKPMEFWSVNVENGVAKTPVGNFCVIKRDFNEIRSDETFDLDKVEIDKLILRSRKDGDKFTSNKRKNTKTLKKLFNEKKISPETRNSIAILSYNDEVVWIDGFGVNEKFKVDEKTKFIGEIKIERNF